MYLIKFNGRKMTAKVFKEGFSTYEAARNVLRKYLRSQGYGSTKHASISSLGYSIVKT